MRYQPNDLSVKRESILMKNWMDIQAATKDVTKPTAKTALPPEAIRSQFL